MSTVVNACQESLTFTVVCDERCTVVRNLGILVKLWDRNQIFTFVDRDSNSVRATELTRRLDESKWSLLLLDEFGEQWDGPEAIPIILKNLPFGKIAAVLYILPGTMWLTHQFYMLISRSKRRFTPSRQNAF